MLLLYENLISQWKALAKVNALVILGTEDIVCSISHTTLMDNYMMYFIFT